MGQVQGMLERLPAEMSGVFLVVSIILALVNCFFGFRLLKFWVSLFGFFTGAGGGYFLGNYLAHNRIIAIIAAVICGIVLMGLAYKVYLAGVFILCGALAYFAMSEIMLPDIWWKFVICLVIGFVIGLIAVKFVRPAVIVSSGIHGGISSVGAMLTVLGMKDQTMALVAGLALAFVGILFQFANTRRLERV